VSVLVWQELYKVHSSFLEALNAAVSNDTGTTIPDCFIMFKEKFIVYGDYCTNLPHAQKKLDQLCKNNPQVQQRIAVGFWGGTEGLSFGW
jgi:guanine nucleotide exchange factor VAV